MSAPLAHEFPLDAPSDCGAPLPVVLVVDDSPVDRRLTGGLAEKCGLRAIYAVDGQDGLAAIAKEAPAVVLTDLQMPNMTGLELVEAIRSDYPSVPVILMTAQGNEEIAIAALRAGASHYLAKRNLRDELPEVLRQVLQAARADRRKENLLGRIEHLECRYVLENDPAFVPLLVAQLQEQVERMGLCDKSRRIRLGVALEEALLNGIYHGNLEVSSDLKQESTQAFERLARQRRRQDPYASRRLAVNVQLNRTQATFVIRDDGPGFDPSLLPDPTDPENMLKPSGRGLLLIRTFMDEAVHNDTGNQLTMTLRRANAQA